MRVLLLGAGGFIGRRLTRALCALPALKRLILADRVPSADAPADARLQWRCGDLRDPAFVAPLFDDTHDVVVHLAATLTLQAEADYRQGLDTNVVALLHLLDLCRRQPVPPKLLFPSSISAFGGTLPEVVGDDIARTPQTSYGTHKAIAELLIADATRLGFVDGRVLRLPIVLTHPGPPSGSVSDRIAALIREPLRGREAVCPLQPDTRFAVASVGAVVQALLQLLQLPSEAIGPARVMNLPSLTVMPAQILDAVAGSARERGFEAVWRWQPDPLMQRVVDGWPAGFTSARALALGIRGDADLAAVVADAQA